MSAASTAHLGNYFTQSLKDRDPELYASMKDELDRQKPVSYTHLTLPTTPYV